MTTVQTILSMLLSKPAAISNAVIIAGVFALILANKISLTDGIGLLTALGLIGTMQSSAIAKKGE